MKNEKIIIPKDVQSIIDELESAGFSAYIVGGCVRDFIMNKKPGDYDICTSATPEQMMKVFENRKIIETGLKHGTITVKGTDDYYEVTTYRVDGEYKDGRHPECVSFVDNIEADLARRDFTVNAMAYNEKIGLVDPFNGIKDIENKLIRCVGDPDRRFSEDALRIMRALRFSAVCDFQIEEETKHSVLRNKDLLINVSAERINTEFCKMLRVAKFDLLNTYKDVFATFIPELKATFYFDQNNWHHKYDVYEHMMHSVDEAPNDVYIRLVLFLHDIGKPSVYTQDEKGIGHFYRHPAVSEEMAEKILRRLKFDTNTIRIVLDLIASHDIEPQATHKFARKMLNRFGREQLERLMIVQECDKKAQTVNIHSLKTFENLEILKDNIEFVFNENQCFTVKDLKINGSDLIDMGVSEGKLIGETLNYLLDKVIDKPEYNEKNTLFRMAKSFIRKKK